MTLCDAMMELKHPTEQKFQPLSFNRQTFLQEMPCPNSAQICQFTSTCYDCGNATISSVAACSKSTRTKSICTQKWFKPVAHHRAKDSFWCPKDECVKNQSNLMLAAALADDDALYWEMDAVKPPSPKQKHPQVEEESLDDSVLMIKTAMSAKKTPKSTLKGSLSTISK